MARVVPVNLVNFTNGLNMRADAFELGEGESPDMLNVDVDPSGGFVARKGWTRWNDGDVAATWNPRSMYVQELSSGTDRVWIANNSKLIHSTSGSTPWTTLQIAAADVPADASPHGADFAPWGDLTYIACGRTRQVVSASSSAVGTYLTASGAANWSPVDTPTTGCAPKAEFIASHAGYLWVAYTKEDGTDFPTRVRWSHPNSPTAWQELDYVDFNEGGGKITGIVPMSDHLLVFLQSAIYAIYGSDENSWQYVNVSRELGAPTRQAIARAEGACFFYSHMNGVYVIVDGERPREVSAQLRPMFTSSGYAPAYEEYVWLGWVGQRLYFSCPYWLGGSATDARSTFVFDPSIATGPWLAHRDRMPSDGAWMLYRGANEYGVGPFVQTAFGGGARRKLACARSSKDVMELEANELPIDNFGGVNDGFSMYYATRWVDGGYPTLKKGWRRPDLVLKERTQAYVVTIEAFKDFDEANVNRSKDVTVAAGGSGAVWGGFTWGDGTIYGPEAKGSTIERGGSFGTARAVQLRISGQEQKPWGVDAIVMKYVPRRMR